MLNRFAVALGAGLASALLFCVTAKGTPMAMAMAYLTPLPIMISALGWGIDANLIASIVAGGVVAGVIDLGSGGIFWLTIALPATLLSGLAAANTLNPFDRATPPARPFRADLGLLAMVAAGLGASVSAGALGVMIFINGGFSKAVAAFQAMLEPTLSEAMGGGVGLPEDLGAADIARLIVRYAPAAIAASTALMLLVNLYAAARVVQLSQRLNRPWADIPTNYKLPALLAVAAVAATGAWAFAPDPYNPFAAALSAPLVVLFAFQGLAVLHALSRRAPGRIALIVALYFAFFLAPRWVGSALALIGLAESVLSLRARQAHPPVSKMN
jgi:hypothetical protein